MTVVWHRDLSIWINDPKAIISKTIPTNIFRSDSFDPVEEVVEIEAFYGEIEKQRPSLFFFYLPSTFFGPEISREIYKTKEIENNRKNWVHIYE